MKPLGMAVLALFLATLAQADDEKIPWITYEGKTYRNPRVNLVESDAVSFSSDDGPVTIPVKSLPMDVGHLLVDQIASARQIAAQRAADQKAAEAEKTTGLRRLGGKVVQVILAGDQPIALQMHDYEFDLDYILTGYPHQDDLVDDDAIKTCLAKPAGVSHLSTPEGTVRTLRKYEFMKFAGE
ncbi:MAG: hypothetical protein QM796_18685 [Chthoniobacteraceae bacterium]